MRTTIEPGRRGVEEQVLAIDALLPQTQCGQCGYAGCLPYARAIAADSAPINRCPPGGEHTIAALAQLLGRAVLAPDPECGSQRPLHVARIDERRCIGCELCIKACPVDAICGSARHMHTVIAADCTGCALCVAPCPVDCIQMLPVQPERAWGRADADGARARLLARQARLRREAEQSEARSAEPGMAASDIVARALLRARRQRESAAPVPASDRPGPESAA